MKEIYSMCIYTYGQYEDEPTISVTPFADKEQALKYFIEAFTEGLKELQKTHGPTGFEVELNYNVESPEARLKSLNGDEAVAKIQLFKGEI